MNHDVIRNKWVQLRGKLKEKWSRLTDDDLKRSGGDRSYLVDKLQERYNIAKEKADVQVKEFERSLR